MILEIIQQRRDEMQELMYENVDNKVYKNIIHKVWDPLIQLMDATFKEGYEHGIAANSIYEEMEIEHTVQCCLKINVKLKQYGF